MSIVIASNKKLHREYIDEISQAIHECVFDIAGKENLTYETLRQISPRYVFFPHWSYIIPAEIYEAFECVIFHMTDLPFGRGGSPLQNLIARGVYETKISAIRCVKELDGGDIYFKRDLSLYGSAEEIYLRASEIVKDMMIEIVKTSPPTVPQQGVPTVFRRRKPDESDIGELNDLIKVFDHIRMLDASGYPAAFLNTKNLHLEFSRASLKDGHIVADVKIICGKIMSLNKRVLVVVAHPDDEILGVGGTILRHIDEGDTVHTIILAERITSRDEGRDVKVRKDELAALHDAAHTAADAIGVDKLILHGLPDNRMDSIPLLDVVKKVEAEIADFRPDTVYTHHGG